MGGNCFRSLVHVALDVWDVIAFINTIYLLDYFEGVARPNLVDLPVFGVYVGSASRAGQQQNT